ncbi:hypothetical protein [uncultured Croceitalea sp.]|uniref:hypothetical protein n=1 Tax=uncultured Croceitalea sp. TaxID=1798908 RepID=UPI003305E17F
MKTYYWLLALLLVTTTKMVAQGPPITADKPIMLGGGSFTTKTLTEIRKTERGTFVYVPLMLHFLPSSNSLVAVHLPYINYDIENGASGSSLADIKILGKYQFFRKDATGKTFRVVAKTLQNLPTGEALDVMELSTGKYSGYYGIVAGYETLKYGISNEVGYNWMPDGTLDEFRYKLGFGLPLLKPQYPNKQINLYFEYTNSWLVERDWYQLLYAQGIQYARKNITFDLAVQVPLVNDVDAGRKLRQSIFLGTRFTF